MEYIYEYLNYIGGMIGFPDVITLLLFGLVIIGGIKLCMKS